MSIGKRIQEGGKRASKHDPEPRSPGKAPRLDRSEAIDVPFTEIPPEKPAGTAGKPPPGGTR